MTREDVPPLLTLSGVVLKPQRDRVGHITSSDRCRRPVGREKKKKPRCLIFGTRTLCILVVDDLSDNERVMGLERGGPAGIQLAPLDCLVEAPAAACRATSSCLHETAGLPSRGP